MTGSFPVLSANAKLILFLLLGTMLYKQNFRKLKKLHWHFELLSSFQRYAYFSAKQLPSWVKALCVPWEDQSVFPTIALLFSHQFFAGVHNFTNSLAWRLVSSPCRKSINSSLKVSTLLFSLKMLNIKQKVWRMCWRNYKGDKKKAEKTGSFGSTKSLCSPTLASSMLKLISQQENSKHNTLSHQTTPHHSNPKVLLSRLQVAAQTSKM